ncbi:calcium-binding protein [Neisseria iguanae]|uniref:Calcium-binding protein n=1 Tax=Neisseria iguanae TaxID=90242 RepID=A0A2P7U3F7_9NEIS|nr:calcium-binding protein [Neisseria iguanae]PSJ81463.1 hypothetical protein C7N83_00080 [Neisseria iguanae]
MNGGAGDDLLEGGAGKDILTGGAGNDFLKGGDGADTYIFAKGHGKDTVSDYGSRAEHTDTLRFSGANHAHAVFTRDGNNLVIKAYGGGDSTTVEGYFSSGSYRYYDFAFDDKTLTAADMPSETVSGRGTDGNDTLYGWSTVDVLDGGLGNDTLYGYEGNDTLNGNEGNDYLSGGGGNDALNGGGGDDRLYGEGGDDVLNGGAGDDLLEGGAGKDILTGGAGNDFLKGGDGADTYIFAKGHGKDTVSDYGSRAEHTDTLIFEDALFEHAVFSQEGSSLVIKAFGEDGGQVSVQNYFSSQSYRYSQFSFDNATVTVDASLNVNVV